MTLSPTKPTRTGYSFLGWSTSSTATSATYSAGGSYTANSAATLYAVWKANTYKVSYNANGGSGAPSAQTKTYGTTLKLSTTKPTRTNYTFLGWSTSASATSATYAAGANYTANAAVTLYAVWKLAYTKPSVTNIVVYRARDALYQDDSGTNIWIEFKWSTFHDVSSVDVLITSSAGDVITDKPTVSGKSGSYAKLLGSGSITTDYTYTVKITVKDSGGSTPITRTVAGTKFAIDCMKGGKGVSFGKPAELANHADFGYFSRFRANSTYDNNVGIYGKTVDDKSLSLMHMNGNDDLVIGYGPYTNGDNSTYIYGTDVIFGVKNTANPGTYRPYIRRGDSINVVVRTSGYVTNSGKDVSFTIPLSRPILGSPTVTVSSVGGFTLRQGTKYTHGSSATATVMPDSYTATYGYTYGVVITAVFSNTTDVTNNDSVGIYWSGNITFT